MKDKNTTTASDEIEKMPISEVVSSNEEDRIYIRYIIFDKYRIGLLENQNHEVIGIKSIEIIKRFYTDEQFSKRFGTWDVEDYYK